MQNWQNYCYFQRWKQVRIFKKPVRILKKRYLAYVAPIISYGLLVCGSITKTNLEKNYLFWKRILQTLSFN